MNDPAASAALLSNFPASESFRVIMKLLLSPSRSLAGPPGLPSPPSTFRAQAQWPRRFQNFEHSQAKYEFHLSANLNLNAVDDSRAESESFSGRQRRTVTVTCRRADSETCAFNAPALEPCKCHGRPAVEVTVTISIAQPDHVSVTHFPSDTRGRPGIAVTFGPP